MSIDKDKVKEIMTNNDVLRELFIQFDRHNSDKLFKVLETYLIQLEIQSILSSNGRNSMCAFYNMLYGVRCSAEHGGDLFMSTGKCPYSVNNSCALYNRLSALI